MNGLSRHDKREFYKSELYKYAQEGTPEVALKRLISDEAYRQIGEKFPKLVQSIVGINFIDKTDDNNILGSVVLATNEADRLLIPVIYSWGKVDATTFLYNEAQDKMIALTKKIVEFLMRQNDPLSGSVVYDTNNMPTLDSGNILKLFVPPKTYTPKIASSNGALLFNVLEKSASARANLINSLQYADNRWMFDNIYGAGASEFVLEIEKRASANHVDNTPPKVLFTLEEVLNSGWYLKKEAAKEFANNGFVISHGANYPKKSLVKLSSIIDRLSHIIGKEAIEGISLDVPGVYILYTAKDMRPVEVVVAESDSGMILFSHANLDLPSVSSARPYIDNNIPTKYIGNKISIDEATSLKPIRELINNKEAYDDNQILVVLTDGTDIRRAVGRPVFGKSITISGGLQNDILNIPTSSTLLRIERNSDASLFRTKNFASIGDNNVYFIAQSRDTDTRGREHLMEMSDLHSLAGASDNLVKVSYDGANYYWNNQSFNKQTLVLNLLKEGFDKKSIYELVKTASDTGNAEMIAINAKIDMLANMIMNLSGWK